MKYLFAIVLLILGLVVEAVPRLVLCLIMLALTITVIEFSDDDFAVVIKPYMWTLMERVIQ